MPFIDFALLKDSVSLEDGIRMLNLQMEQNNNQYRGECPVCEGGDQRTLVITPAKGWFCNKAKTGGDVISLVAHVKQISVKESAQYLAGSLEPRESKPEEPSKQFDPEKYAQGLDCSEEALQPFGVTPELCEKVGWMGISSKGINKGKLVFPLRGEFGEFIDFIGVENVAVPKKWRLHDER